MKQSKKELEEINTVKGRKKFLRGKKILFSCCFCPKGINVDGDDYATIIIEKTGQNFWCHVSCLKKKMSKLCKDELA
jgi:hypothetical protein